MNIKVYVEVTTVFTSDGRMIPKSVRWEDGKEYIIDKVLRNIFIMKAIICGLWKEQSYKVNSR